MVKLGESQERIAGNSIAITTASLPFIPILAKKFNLSSTRCAVRPIIRGDSGCNAAVMFNFLCFRCRAIRFDHPFKIVSFSAC